MLVFHGTGGYALSGFVAEGPRKQRRNYLRKTAFSTTTVFDVAALFAFRKTPSDDFLQGIESGIVLEYELRGVDGRDFESVRDPHCLQEEHEIAVYNVRKLTLLAVWRRNNGEWERTSGHQPPGQARLSLSSLGDT